MKFTISGSLLASLAILFVYTSCTRIDTTDLGSELIPAVDNVNTFETVLDVTTDNVLFNDSSRVFVNQDHALGIIANDPEFGKTAASIYVALEPTTFGSYPFIKRDTVFIDSVVLSLSYASLYGDSNSIQHIEVREINSSSDFTNDSTYRIDQPAFPVIPSVLGSKTVNFTTLNDSVRYVNALDTVRTASELRIKLDTSFGRRFIEYDTIDAYKNDSIFKTRFKGFELSINEGMSPLKNALAYFDLADNSRTKMTFYVRVRNNGKTDTIARSFVNSNDPHANLVSRTPANSYQTYINNGNGNNDDKVYLQTSPGSYALINIIGIDTFSAMNRVIHRAELIAEVLPSTASNIFSPPAALFLDAINAAGDTASTLTNDFIPVNEQPGYDIASFGGFLRNNRYSFNIARYLQSIVTKKFPYSTLRMYAPYATQPFYRDPNGIIVKDPRMNPLFILLNTPIASGRVVLGGGSHPTQKMKLRIIYSKL